MQGPIGNGRDVASYTVIADVISLARYIPALPDVPRFTRERCGAPTGPAQSVIEAARSRNESALGILKTQDHVMQDFGRFRLHVGLVEGRNSKRLEMLAWCWAESGRMKARMPDEAHAFDRMQRQCEAVAVDGWGLNELSEARGWAMSRCFDYAALPYLARFL